MKGVVGSGITLQNQLAQNLTQHLQNLFPYRDGYPSDYSGLAQEMPKIQWTGLGHSPWAHTEEPDFWQQLREKAINLRDNTDKALIIIAGCSLFECGILLPPCESIYKLIPDLIEAGFEVLNPAQISWRDMIYEQFKK